MMKKLGLVLACSFLGAATLFAGRLLLPSFEGAPAGTALPFTPVFLPEVSEVAASASLMAPGQVPGPLSPIPVNRRVNLPDPWAPTIGELTYGGLIIETNAQMRDVWQRLFDEPYDPQLFDFSSDFVVFMGNGLMNLGSFDISSIERVDAEYDDPIGNFPVTNKFLSVTGTIFLPGIPPKDRKDDTYRVSAVRVDRTHLDDAVFHRAVLAAP